MTLFEYHTVIQDVMVDHYVQNQLDCDLNLLCDEGKWEVFNVSVVSGHIDGEWAIQKIYTLRRPSPDPHYLLRKALRTIQVTARMGGVPDITDLYKLYDEANRLYPLKEHRG